jgi:hypothetical protein
MPANDLFNYMRRATHQMQDEYKRIQKRAVEDPGTAGDNGEENWAELLRQWLPSNYHIVTKGRIMNTEGECGPQVDVLVLSPSYPKALLGRKEYLEGGVLAAFECKLTLKAAHIRDAVNNAAQIRRLSRPVRKGTPYSELYTPIRYGLLAHSHVWNSPASTPLQNIKKNLYEAETEIVKHPKEVIDVICVSDLAAWKIGKMIIAGQHLLSQFKKRYEKYGEFWTEIQKHGGVAEVIHYCHAEEYQVTEESKQLFTPIGSFLFDMFEMLAWNDHSLRPFVEYFILTNLGGSGRGAGGMWTIDFFSEELRKRLQQGNCLVDGAENRWSEWQMFF